VSRELIAGAQLGVDAAAAGLRALGMAEFAGVLERSSRMLAQTLESMAERSERGRAAVAHRWAPAQPIREHTAATASVSSLSLSDLKISERESETRIRAHPELPGVATGPSLPCPGPATAPPAARRAPEEGAAPVSLEDPLTPELRAIAARERIEDPDRVWRKFTGHHAGRKVRSIAGSWAKWCANERPSTQLLLSSARAPPDTREEIRRRKAEHEQWCAERVRAPVASLFAAIGLAKTREPQQTESKIIGGSP
jgi:hypothetical protein